MILFLIDLVVSECGLTGYHCEIWLTTIPDLFVHPTSSAIANPEILNPTILTR